MFHKSEFITPLRETYSIFFLKITPIIVNIFTQKNEFLKH